MPLVLYAENIIFQVDSNGGAPAQTPAAQLATNGGMLYSPSAPILCSAAQLRHSRAMVALLMTCSAYAGPPGGALTFGSFTEPPGRPLPHAGSQPQPGPSLPQQRSGALPQGPPQQMPHQQQQQAQRRNAPRNNQGYKGPNYDPGLAGQQGVMHPNAAFNFMPSAGATNYMPQQQYSYAQPAHYYQNGMMIPQGGYQQPAYAAPQPPSRYPRPQPQPGRSGAMAPAQPQQSPPSAPAVPPMKRKTKALDIIDPATQKKVSPRSECRVHLHSLWCTVTKMCLHACKPRVVAANSFGVTESFLLPITHCFGLCSVLPLGCLHALTMRLVSACRC